MKTEETCKIFRAGKFNELFNVGVTNEFVEGNRIEIPIGVDIQDISLGSIVLDDIRVNLFCAGMTGSGKSYLVDDIIFGVASKYSAESIEINYLDFNQVEALKYLEKIKIRHMNQIIPINMEDEVQAVEALKGLVDEIYNRFKILEAIGVTNIVDYNKLAKDKGLNIMKYSIVILDGVMQVYRMKDSNLYELASNTLENILRICRYIGMHVLVFDQSSYTPRGIMKDLCKVRLALRCDKETSLKVIGSDLAAYAFDRCRTVHINEYGGEADTPIQIVRYPFQSMDYMVERAKLINSK